MASSIARTARVFSASTAAVAGCTRCAARSPGHLLASRAAAAAAAPAQLFSRGLVSSSLARAEVRPGPALSQTNRAEATLRRFWKTVHIKQEDQDGGLVVTLDHRNLRTPGGKKLVLPKEKRLVAALIANEWENQEEILKQHALPMTSLASRAMDGMTDPTIRQGVIDHIMRYLETDTICFPDDQPDPLVRMQEQHWDPLRAWLREAHGVELSIADGFSPARQSEDTNNKLRAVLEGMDHWELACLERAVYAAKSLVIGLALVQGRLTAHAAAEAAHVEVRSQIERWGEVEDSHDVDYQDIRRALGSVACLLIKA